MPINIITRLYDISMQHSKMCIASSPTACTMLTTHCI